MLENRMLIINSIDYITIGIQEVLTVKGDIQTLTVAILDAKVEKRPLGTNIPETSAAALRSTHNVYSEKSPTKKSLHHKKKQVVAETPKKHSGWLWALLVVLIIAAGAGLGYLAYTLVFAN